MPGTGKYGKLADEWISEVLAIRGQHLIEDSLFYGRMYFPSAKLEGMYIRHASPAWQYIFSFVSDQQPGKPNAVSLLVLKLTRS